MLKRITKREARKIFYAKDKPLYLCPCKMVPDGPFSMAAMVFGKEYFENAERYKKDSVLWKGTLEETAWDLMYNNWHFYNATYETGYYASYYVEVN